MNRGIGIVQYEVVHMNQRHAVETMPVVFGEQASVIYRIELPLPEFMKV